MAQNSAVHIELRDGAWIVIREGNQRATSVHATQSEAAESGRALARRDGAEFFLHGQDGRVREHHDYRGEETSENVGVEQGMVMDRSVLVPAEVITIDDELRRMVVSRPITVVETAPSLGYDEEVTPDVVRRVRS